MMPKALAVVLLAVFLLASALWAKEKVRMQIASTSFEDSGAIPDQYTCKGQNTSPEVHWKNPPAKTKTFALVVEDPDAPSMTWVHWVMYNIPVKKGGPEANTYELTEGFPRDEVSSSGILQGLNDFRKIGYDGPCPSSGVHRYYFKLYALDTVLSVPSGLIEKQLMTAMKGHILAMAQMMGTYSK